MRTVDLTRDGAVATVRLGRPRQHNALNNAMKTELLAALHTVAEDARVRAVVLAAAGESFCVGQDLAEHHAALTSDGSYAAFSTVERHYSPIVTLLATIPKPVVAAVSGTCVGAGLGLALACDLRVFARSARLGTAFSAIGLTCDSGLSHTLTRSVGESRARELVLTAATFTPEEALAWGIAGRVVEQDEVAGAARALADRLASGPTAAYAESKRLLGGAGKRSLADAVRSEAWAQQRCGATADHEAAVAAFMAKKRPSFAGA